MCFVHWGIAFLSVYVQNNKIYCNFIVLKCKEFIYVQRTNS